MMNLGHQSFTGNASKHGEQDVDQGNYNIYFVLQKYHQVVEELLFPILYHFFYHVSLCFLFLICWDKSMKASKICKIRYFSSPFCCRRAVFCYLFGLVESTILFYKVF